MSWTEKVGCRVCGPTRWEVRDGTWVCLQCGSAMTTAAISDYHKTLCNCPAKDRVTVAGTCQTCERSA